MASLSPHDRHAGQFGGGEGSDLINQGNVAIAGEGAIKVFPRLVPHGRALGKCGQYPAYLNGVLTSFPVPTGICATRRIEMIPLLPSVSGGWRDRIA